MNFFHQLYFFSFHLLHCLPLCSSCLASVKFDVLNIVLGIGMWHQGLLGKNASIQFTHWFIKRKRKKFTHWQCQHCPPPSPKSNPWQATNKLQSGWQPILSSNGFELCAHFTLFFLLSFHFLNLGKIILRSFLFDKIKLTNPNISIIYLKIYYQF